MHSRIRDHVLERLLLGQHASVQNAQNEDAILLAPIKHYVPPFFKAMEAGTNPVAGPSKRWIAGKHLRALLKAVEVTLGLSRTPGLKRVCADAQQVGFGAARKTQWVHG